MSTEPEKYAVKVPLRFSCRQCGEPAMMKIHLSEGAFDWTCPKCNMPHTGIFGLDVTVGVLLHEKSRHEILHEKDFAMAIVFSAMAFESELSRLFNKWKEIACIMPGTEFDREACESELRGFKTIARKIDGVSQFEVGSGMNDFVTSRADLRAKVANSRSLRVGHLPEDFQRHLFWPRNNVLHWGNAKYSYDEAAECFGIAELGLSILRAMDYYRRSLP